MLMVGYNRRYDPQILAVKAKLPSIGTIHQAMTISRDYPYPSEAFLRTCGGLFHDCATHDIDYLNWLLNDRPASVHVTVDSNEPAENYNYQHATVQLQYVSGTMATLTLSRIASSYDQRMEFYGTQGEVGITDYDATLRASFPERYAAAFQEMLATFHKCVSTKTTAGLVTKEECVAAFKVAEACEASVDQGRRVTVQYGESYRNYDNVSKAVRENYTLARTHQTVEFVERMVKYFSSLDDKRDIWGMLETLNHLVDVSDPDLAHPNLHHALQTAERIRQDNKPEWMQLTGNHHSRFKTPALTLTNPTFRPAPRSG